MAVGRPLPGSGNDCKAWAESGAKDAIGATTTIADGGYPGTGLPALHTSEEDMLDAVPHLPEPQRRGGCRRQ
ncbi:hypothetical protein CG723_39590 [Streptomyces sp. CB01635]|nr:hypothetical protein CG723_39590 [Streptomyces sp. CB01635]